MRRYASSVALSTPFIERARRNASMRAQSKGELYESGAAVRDESFPEATVDLGALKDGVGGSADAVAVFYD